MSVWFFGIVFALRHRTDSVQISPSPTCGFEQIHAWYLLAGVCSYGDPSLILIRNCKKTHFEWEKKESIRLYSDKDHSFQYLLFSLPHSHIHTNLHTHTHNTHRHHHKYTHTHTHTHTQTNTFTLSHIKHHKTDSTRSAHLNYRSARTTLQPPHPHHPSTHRHNLPLSYFINHCWSAHCLWCQTGAITPLTYVNP